MRAVMASRSRILNKESARTRRLRLAREGTLCFINKKDTLVCDA